VRAAKAVRCDRASFALAVIAWLLTAALFHTAWSFPFTPIAVAIPVGVCALPLLIRSPRTRQKVRVVAVALLGAFVFLAMLSAGFLFVPATIAMGVGVGAGAADRTPSPPG
jgi:hypothetical protein